MKKVFSVIIIIFSSSLSLSAQVNIDSLRLLWNDTTQPDTVRLRAIDDISWDGYLFSQPDSAFYFAQLEYNFAKSKGLKKQMASALNAQGASFWVRGNYSSAIDHYSRSLTIREGIGDLRGVASSLNNLGINFKAQGNYSVAIDYYTRSLTIITEIGDKKGIASTLNNIGNIYRGQGDIANAIIYYNRSLTIKEEIGDKKGVASSLNNIGIVYSEQGNYSAAHDFHNRSLIIMEKIGNKRGIAACLNSIGNIYMAQENYSTAKDYLIRSIALSEEIEYKPGIAECLNYLGIIYNTQGDFNNAIKHNKRGLKIARELGSAIQIKDAAHALYRSYKSTNKPFQALAMHELYMSTRDSLLSENNQREIIRQEYKYEYVKQSIADSIKNVQAIQKQEFLVAVEVDKNKKKQQQAYILYSGIVLLISLLALFYNRFSLAIKRKVIIDEANIKLIEKNHEIQFQADTINKINKEIRDINESLEANVNDRTKKIEIQNIRLRKYAFSNAHEVRAPVARLLGLIQLWNKENISKTDRDFIIENISVSTLELDAVIKKVSDLLNEEKNDSI